MNDKNKKERKSFYQTMDKQGFYIILLLCIAAITAATLWVNSEKENNYISENPTNPFEEDNRPEVTLVEEDTKHNEEARQTGKIGEGKPVEDKENSSEDVKEDAEESDTKNIKDDIEKDNITQKDNEYKKNVKESKQEREHQQNKKQQKDTKKEKETTSLEESLEEDEEVSFTQSMSIPVAGKLILPFADDYLVYHETLDQWSTHKGIDIKAKEGDPVKAALDGEVVEVVNDTIMGITIVLKHSDDLLTVYSNLSTDAMVDVGEKVKKGQTISSVGKTASAKSLQSPLLHFQVLKDDQFVDPQLYLGDISSR